VSQELVQALREVDAIITPGSRTLASERGSGEMASLTRPASLAGLPALVMPVGFARDNTPIGMQLIGRAWDEATLFRIGHDFERASVWNKRRPGAIPVELPPAYGSISPPASEDLEGNLPASWVMDMARLLDYSFVTEEDAPVIAGMLTPIKRQLDSARRWLKLDVEPPTRAAAEAYR
jgi:hypothetical protein